ncbi:MAG: hypothetical protein ACO1QS_05110, partial [Verrucomicrobiota bacterium]
QHDDPLELDEVILHVHALNEAPEAVMVRTLNNRFAARTEFRPNRIEFHDAATMRELQGVGTQLKEQKVVDHRPKATAPKQNGTVSINRNHLSEIEVAS